VGLKPDDLIDSDVVAFGDLVHPDDREWVWTLEQECLAEHKPCELQYRLVTPAGIVKWVWDRSEGIYDEKGTVVGLEGYCEDITAFKQQEQVLHSMNQNLEKQINENRELAIANAMDKEKYKRLIDNLPGYVYKSNCDEKWTIQSRSKGVENLFEISLEKTAEKNDINIGDLMHPDDRERVWHSARAAIACRRPYEAQYRIITASGVEKWVWERAQGVYDADGNVIYIEGYIEDITSMKRREIELSDARAKAEAAVRAKSAFIANINHEIRTPLNAIVGFSELIAAERLGPLGNSAYREFAQHIRNSAGSLLAIVNTIMDLNRIQSGDASPDIQVIDPGEVVASLVRLWKAHAADRGITVEFHNAAGGSRLRTDEQHLHKIVDNLLSNAVKFTHENGSVHVSLRLDNHRRIVLGVNDDGIGMYPEHVAKVTEAFFQINNDINRSTGGIGLGLTLVSAYVKLHGAALNIDSTPGKGTCIEVTFPTTATVGEAAASLSRRSKLATARPQH
jgi:PAS domain S-box-containing protein